MRMIKRLGNFIQSFVSKAWDAFDVRDFCVLGGLGMLSYGLYLRWGEWLAFMVCGVMLMIIGYITGDK